MTDQHPPTDPEDGVPPLVAAAAAIDPELPSAWARIEAYLQAYAAGEATPTGLLGRRKDSQDRITELHAADLRTALDGLSAAIDAVAGPSEAAAVDDVLRKLDVLLERTAAPDEARATVTAARPDKRWRSLRIRLEGNEATVTAAREAIARVLDIDVRATKPRRGGELVHQYLAVRGERDADGSAEESSSV